MDLNGEIKTYIFCKSIYTVSYIEYIFVKEPFVFIDLNSNVDDSKPPSRSLFEYVKEVLTRPQWIMSDISIDKPYKHAISILLIIGVSLGLGLGFHGSLWFRGGIVGAFYGGVFFAFVFARARLGKQFFARGRAICTAICASPPM